MTRSRSGVATMLRMMPRETVLRVGIAAVAAAALAGLETVALLVIYPVFGYLADTTATDGLTVPLLGWQVTREDAAKAASLALGLLMARAIAAFVYRRWWLSVAAHAERKLGDHVLRRYAYAPYEFHTRSNTAAMATHVVQNVNRVCTAGLNGLVGMMSEGFTVALLGAAVVAVNPPVGLTALAYLGGVAGVYWLVARRYNRVAAKELTRATRKVYVAVGSILTGIRELTLYGAREALLGRASSKRLQMAHSARRLAMLQTAPGIAMELAVYGMLLVVVASLLSGAAPDALPLVGLYVLAAFRLLPAVVRLLASSALMGQGTAVASELNEELTEIDALPVEEPSKTASCPSREAVILDSVGFTYQGESRPALEDVSITVPFGKCLGIRGPSGSGKSTLLGVLLGLLSPTAGSVRYGDWQVPHGSPTWFSRIAVVPQEVFITDDTFAANLAFGRDWDLDAANRAVAAADLTSVIDALPEGFGTVLHESGARLSAGQKQRLGLARALYGNPEILVLDEATSALDSDTEERIVTTLRALKGSMTIIAVAHRENTLTIADRVVTLEAGRLRTEAPADDRVERP